MDYKKQIEKWNRLASHFNDLKIPIWGEDNFLNCIDKLPIWEGNPVVMDLGCGAGRYSLALSTRSESVLGTDISPAMIDFANKKAEENQVKNVSFKVENWADIDVEKEGYKDKFDLIIGHMTPAIASIEDVKKLNEASKGYCAICKFASRKDPLQDKLVEALGLKNGYECKGDIPEFFLYLDEGGYNPQLTYYKRNDTRIFNSKEDAFNTFKGYFADKETSEACFDDAIWNFIEENSSGNKLINPVKSVIVAMTWKAKK